MAARASLDLTHVLCESLQISLAMALVTLSPIQASLCLSSRSHPRNCSDRDVGGTMDL